MSNKIVGIAIGLSIQPREGGGVRIISNIPGLVLSGSNPKTVFEDLGPVLRKLLVTNEGHVWLKADHEHPPASPVTNQSHEDSVTDTETAPKLPIPVR